MADAQTEAIEEGTLEAYIYKGWSVTLTIEEDDFFGPPVFVFYLEVTKDGHAIGRIDVVAVLEVRGDELWLRDAHVHGLEKGRLGREGLNAVAHAVKESAGAKAVVVEGGTRTTGVRPGHAPKRFRYPAGRDPEPGGTD